MIRCYLLYLEAVLLKPPGDLIDIILRSAEARRVLPWSQELLILRGMMIMLLRDKLLSADCCAESGCNSRTIYSIGKLAFTALRFGHVPERDVRPLATLPYRFQ